MSLHFLDQFSLVTLFLGTVLLLVLSIELGFFLGNGRLEKTAKAQASQVRSIMGASLGLLAFMMAFTFSSAQNHYETRVHYMVEEARLASNAFLQADLLKEPYRTDIRQLLRRYIGDRLEMGELVREHRIDEVLELVETSEAMQNELWRLALTEQDAAGIERDASARRSPFTLSVIGLIDIHAQRLQASLMNRIPNVIWLSLYLTGFLAMLVMGYQAGLVTRRSPLATYTLALAFAAVLMLITDLDRPIMSLFHIDNQVMVNLAERMDHMLAQSVPGGGP